MWRQVRKGISFLNSSSLPLSLILTFFSLLFHARRESKDRRSRREQKSTIGTSSRREGRRRQRGRERRPSPSLSSGRRNQDCRDRTPARLLLLPQTPQRVQGHRGPSRQAPGRGGRQARRRRRRREQGGEEEEKRRRGRRERRGRRRTSPRLPGLSSPGGGLRRRGLRGPLRRPPRLQRRARRKRRQRREGEDVASLRGSDAPGVLVEV